MTIAAIPAAMSPGDDTVLDGGHGVERENLRMAPQLGSSWN